MPAMTSSAPSTVLDGDTKTDRGPSGLPLAPKRQRNTPWIVGGVLLILLGGLGAASLASSLSDRVDVVVAARVINEGQVITPADLTTASIAGGDGATATAGERIPELVGQVATADIPSGTILHPDLLIDAQLANPRLVVVGFELAPGAYPIRGLLPGDAVQIVGVRGTASQDDGDENAPRFRGVVTEGVITEGEVTAVAPLVLSDNLLVSVRVEERFAPAISTSAHQDRVRLTLLGSGQASGAAAQPEEPAETVPDAVDEVEPLEPAAPADPADPAEAPPVDGETDSGTDG